MTARVSEIPALRELYREFPSGRLYRIVHAERGSSDVVLCEIFGSTLKLMSVSFEEFRVRSMPGYEGEGRLVQEKPENDPYGPMRRPCRSTPAGDEQSELNWNRIKQFVNDPDLFRRALKSGSDRKNILQDIADASGVTIQRIRKLHREYLQRGMTQDAVSSELWRCGRRHQPARYAEGENANPTIVNRNFAKRPGRTPSRHGMHALRTKALEQLFEQYIDIYITSKLGPWNLDISDELIAEIRRFNGDAIFPAKARRRRKAVTRPEKKRRAKPSRKRSGARARVTWQDLVDHLNYVCRCIREVRDTSGQIIELKLALFGIVSRRQLTYYYKTRVPVEVQKLRQMGPKEYAGSGRPIKGHALQHSVGPGAEYMIDATIADVFLLLAYDRTVVVGRPTVYLAMDVWSRMIVGFYISFDPPSFESVALILENIATPKQELCARYGISVSPGLWPCEYLPSSGFLLDRGSDFMKTERWQTVNKRLSTPVSNVRAWDPTMRALVERRFGIIPAYFQRATFGVVEADAATRGAPGYVWDATLTIVEFTRRLARAILRYIQTPIGRDHGIPQMVTSGLANTPLNRWNWGMDHLTGSLKRHSIDEIRCATWPTEFARPTRKGLEWRGGYYTSPIVESKYIHCWGKESKKPVPIQFDPNDASRIILAGDDFREYAHFAKTNAAMPAEGTLMEREIYRHLDRRNTREEHDALEQNRVMDLLNNAEENRNAEREKQAALKRAGLHHPTRQGRHAASVHRPNAATDGRSSFGKFKLEKAEVGTGKTGLSEHDLVKQTKTVEEDAIIESIAESTRNLLDN